MLVCKLMKEVVKIVSASVALMTNDEIENRLGGINDKDN